VSTPMVLFLLRDLHKQVLYTTVSHSSNMPAYLNTFIYIATLLVSFPFIQVGIIAQCIALYIQSISHPRTLASPSKPVTPSSDTFCLITGAARGLGSAMAEAFASRGWNVILLDRTDIMAAAESLAMRHGVRAISVTCDLSNLESTQALITTLTKYEISIFVSNAGVAYSSDFVHADMSKLIEIMNVNMISNTYLLRAIIARMVAKNVGRVVVVSSVGAHTTPSHQAVYFASKAYLSALIGGVDHELKNSDVNLLLLEPGPIADTSFRDAAACSDSLAFKVPGHPRAAEIADMTAERLLGAHPFGVLRPGISAKATAAMFTFLERHVQASPRYKK
jgi:short-subunit dehydrogenase